MSIERGQVVLSLAGRDTGEYAVVLDSTDCTVTVANGKSRPIARPKMKNLKHVRITAYRLDIDNMVSDKWLRSQLNRLQPKHQ